MDEAVGWDSSAQAWLDRVEKDANRVGMLDQLMLELCGEVERRRVLDVGAGDGRFSRMLTQRGAFAIPLDPTLALLRSSSRTPRPLLARAEDLPIATGSQDLVVSYLSLIDIADFRRAIREMSRVLVANGRLVIANLNSFMTTFPSAWHEDEEGNPVHVKVDEYLTERAHVVSWCGITVENWHRPMADYLQALLGAGLRLESFQEVRPTAEALAAFPQLASQLRVPYFHVMSWIK